MRVGPEGPCVLWLTSIEQEIVQAGAALVTRGIIIIIMGGSGVGAWEGSWYGVKMC